MGYSKRCIVTGAAGFIGSALVRILAKGRLSYMCIVRQMMMSEEYKNSMKIKSANTWVVQASSKWRG